MSTGCVLLFCLNTQYPLLFPPVSRFKSQISEIENSMKQTWEEKTKLSAQYDAERRRMVRSTVMDGAR